LPGVTGMTLVGNRPGSGWSDNNDIGLDGVHLMDKNGSPAIIRSNDVGPNFLHTFQIPIVQGRDIGDEDAPSAPPVVLVNETFVKRFLPHTDPLGHTIWDGSSQPRTIVGVAKDSKYTTATEGSTPVAYYPALQQMRAGESLHVEVRSAAGSSALLATIATAVREIDPDVPLQRPNTQVAEFENSYAEPTLFARLAGFFGGLAALLVGIGLYGTLAYRTNRRTSEIGMRMALGSRRAEVLWLVMRESLFISVIGVAAGLPLAIACSRLLDSMLYELSPFDPLSFAFAVCSIALVSSVAALLPAQRAAKVDPMVALRYE